MNTSDVPGKIFRDAIDEVNRHLSKWPHDEWISLSEDFDLNLSISYGGEKVATIYAVKDGNTQTEEFVQIFSQTTQEPRLQS